MRTLRGIGGALIGFFGLVLRVVVATGGYIEINGKRIYAVSIAITGNVTTTDAPAGSIGITTHTTGRGSIFVSDGAKWQAHLAITPLEPGVNVAPAGDLTSAALTDNSGGTANDTVQAIGATYDQAEVANNFADAVAQINALRVDLAAVRTSHNDLITSLINAGVIAAE